MKLLKLLLLFTAFSSFAQIRFEPGYFIDNSGIRQDVLIRNTDWKNNPAAFEYKTAEGAETQKRGIDTTAEFSVGNNTYKRFDVSIDRSSTVTDKMSDNPVIDWKSETLLLKRLVSGKLALYQYEDSNLVKYFYSDGDHTKATQLLYHEHKQDGRIMKNTNFRQQLFNLMKDKYTDAKKFKNTKYNLEALSALFDDYNDNNPDNAIDGNEKGYFHINIAAGIAISSLRSKAPGYIAYGNDFARETSLRAGLQLEYIFPFNKNKWALLLDPNYQSYSSENTLGANNWKAEYQRLEIPVMIRHYFYLSDKSKIFLNGSYMLNFSLGDSYIIQNSAIPIEIEKASSWGLGAGFSYSRFSLETRYVFKHQITNSGYWQADFSAVNFILAYQLF